MFVRNHLRKIYVLKTINMSQRTDISLRNFFIYNAKLGPKEGEEEKKILYYYPKEVDLDTKIKDVGFCEAIIKFTNTFTADESCQHLRTQKTIQLYYQTEPDFWMIMTINVPYEKKEKQGQEYNEYKCDDVHNKIYREILKQSYKMFRLFLGTFSSHLICDNLLLKSTALIEKLDLFYSRYLLTLKLQNCDILDVFKSIQYFPLNKLLFLRVHNFVQMIEATFPMIKNCIFLYNEQLVWSEINPIELYCIYEYLIGTLFPKTAQTELRGGSLSRSYSFDTSHYGSFVTGPENFENSVKVPKVFITNDGKCEPYFLVVYRALSATICLFIEGETTISDDIYNELHAFMGPQLTSIASEIGENFVNEPVSQNSIESSGPKYLFFNELSLKHIGTMHINQKSTKQSQIPTEVMNLIADLFSEDITKACTEETVLKTLNDYWIVKKTSNWRHFYVVVHKSSSLLEITEEAKRLFDEHAKNVFFEK